MTDINLQALALTPTSPLPTTGFLFGADSQPAASPSVYGVTTAITTILGNAASSDVLAFNSDTTFSRGAIRNFRFGAADAATALAQTLSVQSVVAGTSNTAGAAFTVTGSRGTGTGAGGSIIFQVAPAGSASTFTVTFTNGSATISGTGLPATAGTAVAFTTTGALPTNFAVSTTYFVLAGSTSTAITVAATAGGTAIVAGSAGSGTQTLTQALAQNALSTALTIEASTASFGDRYAAFTGRISCPEFMTISGSNKQTSLTGNGLALSDGKYIGFTGSTNALTSLDSFIFRDAANTLAQRNGVNAQTSRLYLSYTDGSNYTRLALKTASGVHTLETESAGSGEANIDLALTPKGTGRVRYGTHAAIVAEIVTGYIEIKDAAGTVRKLAVIS